MIIPDYQSLMLPVLVASSNGEVQFSEVVKKVGDQLGLTSEQRTELLPSGKQTVFNNRVHWAKTYLAQAGLVENTRRGHFKITLRGEQALIAQPNRIDNVFLSQYEDFQKFKERVRASETTTSATSEETGQSRTNRPDQVETPDEQMRRLEKQINATLTEELLGRINEKQPAFFERLIVRLLIKMGYGDPEDKNAGRTLGGSGDDGVDGVIDQDSLGLDRVYVQAKRYGAGNVVGSGAIRDFFGSLDRHKANKGIFVTTSSFSSSAKETAEFLSKRIVLIDGRQLATLMVRHNIGCQVADTFLVKKIDEDYFEPES